MLSTGTAQKQYGINRHKMSYEFCPEHAKMGTSLIIQTMLKIIKITSRDNMNNETRMQFSKIVDAAIQLAEEI